MMCSVASPRVSFSHDSGQAEEGVHRRDTELLDMNSDFEFNITSSSEQESCSADELFANGFILPVQFQNTSKQVKRCAAPPTVSLPPLPPSHENLKKCLQIIEVDSKSDLGERPSESKSFWGFKRSSSLNCDVKKSLIRSLLSRSNSTGSQQSPSLKENKHHRSQKLQASSSSSPSPSLTSSTSNPYQSRQNKKNCHGNGVKVSPVLNLPPPYISKGTANLFGFGSLLRSSSGSKDKKNKK